MKKTLPAPRAGRAAAKPRKHRPRATPKWLTDSSGLEAMARSRCLMLLSVLSGETPVTDAIAKAKISRGTYYQLETRALNAILAAMNPLAASATSERSAASERIVALEAQLKRSEQERRRTQRLLLLTRKSIRAPLTTGHRGRLPKALRLSSSPAGRGDSLRSMTRILRRATVTESPSPTPPGVRSP